MDIFLTLDYELFLGLKPGSQTKCLLEPMNALASIVEKHDARFTIFVDAPYLLKLTETGNNLQIFSQIEQLSNRGHDIELHFHPQWLYSNYTNGSWDMDLYHYKLSDMPLSEINYYFTKAKNILDSIIDKPTIAFRAGGYSLNSFVGYADLLRRNGILIDSSVCEHICVNSEFQAYDYRHVPSSNPYTFSSDLLFEDPDGDIIEMPITLSDKIPGIFYLLKRRKTIKEYGHPSIFGDGIGVGAYAKIPQKKENFIERFIKYKTFRASIDGFQVEYLPEIYHKLKNKRSRYMLAIGHPKNASYKSIERLDNFLSQISAKDKVITIRDFYERNYGGLIKNSLNSY